LLGDDVQHLIAWYHVLRTQRADSTVTELAVEADDAGNVDDLTLRYANGSGEYWQIKASVDATSPLTEASSRPCGTAPALSPKRANAGPVTLALTRPGSWSSLRANGARRLRTLGQESASALITSRSRQVSRKCGTGSRRPGRRSLLPS
jgi:hypothetical protein